VRRSLTYGRLASVHALFFEEFLRLLSQRASRKGLDGLDATLVEVLSNPTAGLFVSGQPPYLQTPGLLRLREPGPCAYTYQSFSPLDKASILFGNCTAIDIWNIARTSTVCRWQDTTIYPVVVGGTVLQCIPLCLVLIS
jgi:hypothetical protein